MKKLIYVLGSGMIIFSCVGHLDYVAPPIPPNLCQEHNKEDSTLLKIQNDYNIPLNEVYYGLIDTARIMMITDVAEKEWILKYLDEVAEFYSANYPTLTFDKLINYMISEERWKEKVSLALSILSTRIRYFKVEIFISEYDDCLLKAGWTNARKLL